MKSYDYSKNELNTIREGHHSPLTIAVCRQDFAQVQYLLDNKADVNWHGGRWGNSALTWSVANSNNTMTLYLLDNAKDLNVDIGDYQKKTALHLAIAKGWYHFTTDKVTEMDFTAPPQAPVIQRLIELTSLDLQDNTGNTPLHIAMLRRDHAVVEELLRKGASLEIKNTHGHTPLDLLRSNFTFESVNEYLNNYAAVQTFDKHVWEASKPAIEKLIMNKQEHKTIVKEPELKNESIRTSSSTNFLHASLSNGATGLKSEQRIDLKPEHKAEQKIQEQINPNHKVINYVKERLFGLNNPDLMKKLEENKDYADILTKLYDVGFRDSNTYQALLEEKDINKSVDLLMLCKKLKEYKLLGPEISSAFESYTNNDKNRIALLNSMVLGIENVRSIDNKSNAEFEKACKNLIKSDCFNKPFCKQLTDSLANLYSSNRELSKAIITGINSLADMGYLDSLNESDAKAIQSIKHSNSVENVFNQIAENIMQNQNRSIRRM
ncbi:MAG: ankyrin repeat domain-containing protein [Gammaproteobacteria bacterium]|nr:ankyrin repeat domain-containing protein [Gammaproteobacteria bacterium]